MNKLITIFLFIFISAFYIGNINADTVTVSGRKIFVGNEHYIIKGICYHPVPLGSDNRSFDNLAEDLEIMSEAGINTIRVYSPIADIDVLNQINESGIKIIMGFGYNQNGQYDILSGTFLDYVKKFKNHDAILLWELGNEYNYHPEWFNDNIHNWYSALNKAADAIHKHDPNHPVTTAHGELPNINTLALCPNIDVWGMNVYRWDNPENIFSEWCAVSSKPMYLSEAGADSYMTASLNGYDMGLNEKAQADATKNILDDIFENTDICCGVTLFAFVDELWKAGNNNQIDPGGWAPESSGVPYDGAANEEYWGDRKSVV